MKLIPEELVSRVVSVIADARQTSMSNLAVFNVLQELRVLQDAPQEMKPS